MTMPTLPPSLSKSRKTRTATTTTTTTKLVAVSGGTTLIDIGDLFSCPDQVRRRIVLISGYHTNPTNDYSINPVFVSFSAAPQIVKSGCRALSLNSEPLYKGSYVWTRFNRSKTIVDVRNSEDAFGVVLLDEPVPDNVVPGPLPVVASYPPAPYMQPGPDCISQVGLAAYGAKGVGKNGTVLGTPTGIPQPPVRQYVEIDVVSVLESRINMLGVAALEEGTLCFGDGGSGIFPTQPDSTGQYTLLGMEIGAQPFCRSGLSGMRLDTETFQDYIKAIDCHVCQKAGTEVTCRASEAARTAEGFTHSAPIPLTLILRAGLGGGVGLLAVVAAVSAWRTRRPAPLLEEPIF